MLAETAYYGTKMRYDFDLIVERRHSDSDKWRRYGPDVLPLWVADMDFRTPEPILQALRADLEHGILGYGQAHPAGLLEAFCHYAQQRHQWTVEPEQVVLLPGLVSGLNVVCRAVGEPGDAVLTQTPVYPPFMSAASNQGRESLCVPLQSEWRGEQLYYRPDFAALRAAITPRTKLFLLCHPHNPVGRVFTAQELAELADICQEHDLIICSDEVHGDLALDGPEYRPLAALEPRLAERCITLLAPSKTYNIAGLGASIAVIPNPKLRRQVTRAMAGSVPHPSILAVTAAEAAYRMDDQWRLALLDYLRANRDFLLRYLAENLPQLRATCPEATYLAWIDCRATSLGASPQGFFLKHGLAFNDGPSFGPGGEGFVRLNFGCPRSVLQQALEQMRRALSG